MGVDALTCEWWHDLQPWRWGCDCQAKHNDAMAHDETCWVTPIYAQLCLDFRESPRDTMHDFYKAYSKVVLTQTVIKCAQCGRERLGRDMDVVYQVPGPRQTDHVAIMKQAVCPEHNRIGTSRWVGVR